MVLAWLYQLPTNHLPGIYQVRGKLRVLEAEARHWGHNESIGPTASRANPGIGIQHGLAVAKLIQVKFKLAQQTVSKDPAGKIEGIMI